MDKNKIYSLEEIKTIIEANRKTFSEKYFVGKILLFGSYAKNQQTATSDIDLLVDFEQPIDMFEFLNLQEFIENLFNKKIDLGTSKSLKSFIRESILKDAIVL